MKHAAAKIVPKLQNFERPGDTGHVHDHPDLLKKAITGDESWVYDIELNPNHPNGSI